jgi:hypothetical protein
LTVVKPHVQHGIRHLAVYSHIESATPLISTSPKEKTRVSRRTTASHGQHRARSGTELANGDCPGPGRSWRRNWRNRRGWIGWSGWRSRRGPVRSAAGAENRHQNQRQRYVLCALHVPPVTA